MCRTETSSAKYAGDTQQGMRQAGNRAKAMAEMRATDNVSRQPSFRKLLRYAAYPGLLGR